MTSTVVVTFPADTAEIFIGRFRAWSGDEVTVEDLGVCDGRRRYKVPRTAWRSYTNVATTEARCSCGLLGSKISIGKHQEQSGHVGFQ